MRIRTLIADDQGVILEGLRHLLEDAGCEVVGTAENGRELVRLAEALRPNLVVLGVSMPVLNGVEAARQIRRRDTKVRLLFLSIHSDAVYVRQAFGAGANGYLLTRSPVSEIAPAIREIMLGGYYITPLVTKETITQLLSGPGGGNFGSNLTPRQREVLQLVAEGKTAKEAAAILNVSVKTIEFHKTNIMRALGLRGIADLTRYAMAHKMVEA
jgi:DNA-binding NarL/FixJ family response regulator